MILLWAVALVNMLLEFRLNGLGIRPRTLTGLLGILMSPFIHAGISHVLTNTIPFAILGLLVMLNGTQVFLEASVFIGLVSGLGVWLVARSANHVGASGLIFGYFGFLVGRAWHQRSLISILIALLTILLYGGMLWGALPLHWHISWEGHLFGLLAGILAAWLMSDGRR